MRSGVVLPAIRRYGALFSLLGIPAAAHGVLTIAPTIEPMTYFDDNRRIRAEGSPSLVASEVDAGFDAVYTRPTYRLTLAPDIHFIRHSDQTELDSEDYFVDLFAEKFFERHQIAGGFNFERESSATTELDDSGRLDTAVPRTTLGLNASWGFLASEQVTLTAFGAYSDVSFKESETSRLTDYRFATAGLNLRYQFSERTDWLVNTSISLFDTPAFSSGGQRVDGETKSYAFQFGFEHAFSDTVDGSLLVGQNISSFKVQTTRPVLVSLFPFRVAQQRSTTSGNDGGLLVDSSVVKRFEQGQLEVEWTRSFNASSQGSRSQRQTVTGRGVYNIDDNWRVRFNTRYREQEQETLADVVLRPLDIITVLGGLEYKFTREMSMELTYRFRHQERSNLGTTAVSHRVGLQFRYRGEAVPYLR